MLSAGRAAQEDAQPSPRTAAEPEMVRSYGRMQPPAARLRLTAAETCGGVRWCGWWVGRALLHTLVSLFNPSAKKNAGASASSEDDLIRSFTSASPAFWAGGLPRSTLLSQGEAAGGIHQDGGSRNASSLHR